MSVSEILSYSVDEILQSHQLTMALLKMYSKLYLSGRPPRGCSKSIRGYYIQLRDSNIHEKNMIMKKTNKFDKLVFTQGQHWSDSNLTDEKAFEFLSKGILKESDFVTLPESWKNRKHKDVMDGGEKKDLIDVDKKIHQNTQGGGNYTQPKKQAKPQSKK